MFLASSSWLLLCWMLLWFDSSSSAPETDKKSRPLEEILADWTPTGNSTIENEFEALVRYDKVLYEAYKSVISELPPKAANWGKLGMLFYERDRTWKQGGAAEAASQVKVAMQLAALNLKQRTMLRVDVDKEGFDDEYVEDEDSEMDVAGQRSKLESLDTAESQIDQIGKWLEKSRRQEGGGDNEDAFVTRLREDTFAWSLQYAILNSYLGLGKNAIKFLDFAEQYSAPQDGIDGDYRWSSDRAILTFHRADVYLRSLNQPEKAAELFLSFLKLDGCGQEAGEARMKYVQAKILAEENEERGILEEESLKDGRGNEKISAFREMCVAEWEELASQWAFEVTIDPAFGVSRVAVQCHGEHVEALRRADTSEGGVRLVGKPQEQHYFSSPSLAGAGIESGVKSGQTSAVPPLSTMIRWALFSVHDHLASILQRNSYSSSSTAEGAEMEMEMEIRAMDHRQQAWEHLEGANAAEKRLRGSSVEIEAGTEKRDVQKHANVDEDEDEDEDEDNSGGDGAISANGDDPLGEFFFEVDPEDTPGEMRRKGQEKLAERMAKANLQGKGSESSKSINDRQRKGQRPRGGYTLAVSAQKAQALKRIFTKGYWPPDHLGVGSNSTELVFIVGFFRSGSTLLERMLSASPYFVGIGEHSPVGMELRALEQAMLANEEENERRVERGEAKAAPMKAMKRAQDQILQKMRARANGTMAYTGYQPVDGAQGYSRVPVGGESKDYRSRRIIDKMLLHYRSIGMIHLLFPKAPILHLVRDPMDTLLSCYKTRFIDDASTYTLEIGTLAREYGLYVDIMRHFRQQLPEGRITDISYSALVSQPRATLAPVLREIGQRGKQSNSLGIALAWDEKIVRHHKPETSSTEKQEYVDEERKLSGLDGEVGGADKAGTSPSPPMVRTASYLQVKKPLYTSAVGSWLKYQEYAHAIRDAYRLHVYGPLLEAANSNEKIENQTFPFGNSVNWQASTEYDYLGLINTLKQGEWPVERAVEELKGVKIRKVTKKVRKKKRTI